MCSDSLKFHFFLSFPLGRRAAGGGAGREAYTKVCFITGGRQLREQLLPPWTNGACVGASAWPKPPVIWGAARTLEHGPIPSITFLPPVLCQALGAGAAAHPRLCAASAAAAGSILNPVPHFKIASRAPF